MDDNDSLRARSSIPGYTNVYKWHNGNWVPKGQPIVGPTDLARSGFSVAISADCSRVVSGAPYNNVGGDNVGRVRIYDYDDGVERWVQSCSLKGKAHELFGASVAMTDDGTRVAVGAVGSTPIGNPNLNDPYGAQAGNVQIYDWNGIGWEQVGATVKGVASYDQFGYNIILSPGGDRLLISSPFRDNLGVADCGSVRVVRVTPVSGGVRRDPILYLSPQRLFYRISYC